MQTRNAPMITATMMIGRQGMPPFRGAIAERGTEICSRGRAFVPCAQ
jgi:hypothetical protein